MIFINLQQNNKIPLGNVSSTTTVNQKVTKKF